MSEIDAWALSGAVGDAPTGDPVVGLFEWDWVWVLHSPAETVRRGVRTLDARRPYGWWRTAEVRQLVLEAVLARRMAVFDPDCDLFFREVFRPGLPGFVTISAVKR